jgi:hypothetical protein
MFISLLVCNTKMHQLSRNGNAIFQTAKHCDGVYDPGMLLTQHSPTRDVCSGHIALIQWKSCSSVKETTTTVCA